MLVFAPGIRSRLHGIVNHLVPPLLREDLMQEAMVHLWRAEEQDPGRDEIWYLQSCRLHLQNYVRLGRSVDSWKRFHSRLLEEDHTVEGFPASPQAEVAESVWDEFGVNDLLAKLVQWLTPREKDTLHCLMDGLSARETARRLGLSHTVINRHRSRIASLALKLGVAPTRNRAYVSV